MDRVSRWLRMNLPRTLFARTVLILVTPAVLLQAISFYIFYERHWETVTRRLAAGIAGEIALIIEELGHDPEHGQRDRVLDRAFRHLQLIVIYRPGAELDHSPVDHYASPLDQILANALDERVARPYTFETTLIDNEIAIDVQLPHGVLEVTTLRKRLFSSTTYVFLMWMLGSAILLFTIALIFMRNQVRAIRRLAAAADSFGKGQDVPRFKPEGALEVRRAAQAMMTMHARLQRHLRQRTEMLAGVSHDLRTPLTRMKLELALLPPSDEVEELKADVVEMEKMVEGYLAFARGEAAEEPEMTRLPALLDEVVGQVRRQGGAVELATEGDLRLLVRPEAVRRCLANLISNACRYGRRVAVHARREGQQVTVTVDDDGPGVPAEAREDVFRPFVRLDPSRNPRTGGVGLGLTIARDVARSHGGELTLEDSPLGGARAVLRLPM